MLTLEQAMKAQIGSAGIAWLFNLGARWGWEVNVMPQLLYLWERNLVPIVQEAGWASWLLWIGAENLAPTSIRSLDHAANSELLY